MNGKDFIAVLEYAKVFNKDKPNNRRRKKETIDLDNLDLAEVFLKLTAKEEKIKAAKKQIEQLLKKEEKKEEKKHEKISATHLAMWFIATAPLTGPLVLWYWAKIFASIQGMH